MTWRSVSVLIVFSWSIRIRGQLSWRSCRPGRTTRERLIARRSASIPCVRYLEVLRRLVCFIVTGDMARLQTLKSRIQAAAQSRVKVLDTKAGTTEMERGRAWMAKRHRIALAHGYQCAGCRCVWVPSRDQIDHKVPREQGGSNDESNLQPLCKTCHDAKTAAEARIRARGW